MSHSSTPPTRAWRLGRGLVMLAALIYGVLPAIIDLFTPQHVGDPHWTGHPRFHLLWQISLVGYLGLSGLVLAWRAHSPAEMALLERSVGMGLTVLAAFVTAGLLTIPLGGAFGQPDQVILGVPFPIAHFSIAGLVLLSGYGLCRREAAAQGQVS